MGLKDIFVLPKLSQYFIYSINNPELVNGPTAQR